MFSIPSCPLRCGRPARRLRLWLLAALLCGSAATQAQNVDSLYAVLDACIGQRAHYERQFQRQMAALKRQAATTTNSREQLRLWTRISHEEYRHNGPEALKACGRAIELARRLADRQSEAKLLRRKALTYGMMGLPWEGERLLDSLARTPELAREGHTWLPTAYYDLYDFYTAYAPPGQLADRQYAFLAHIEDSVRRHLTAPARQAMTLHHASYDERQMINSLKDYLRQAPAEAKGVVATVISNKYAMIRDLRHRNYYWAMAAIYNIQAARHENEALTRLAIYLFDAGDTERATRYILAAYDDARQYDTRIRKAETAAPLARGLSLQQQAARRQARQLGAWRAATVALLALLLGAGVVGCRYVRRQRRLRREAARLSERHHALIGRLQEEARVKNDYITRFLELSLDSVFQIEQLRHLLLLKIKHGETDRLQHILTDPERFDRFQHLCLQRFDIAFLRLYPDFTQTVNALLRPDEQVKLPDREILSNELRVLAFMRLGITDSMRIATILGVSTNTVYFYRNKLRRKALHRDTFEQEVMHISEHFVAS